MPLRNVRSHIYDPDTFERIAAIWHVLRADDPFALEGKASLEANTATSAAENSSTNVRPN